MYRLRLRVINRIWKCLLLNPENPGMEFMEAQISLRLGTFVLLEPFLVEEGVTEWPTASSRECAL